MDQERRNKYLQGMLLKRLHDHLQILCFQFLQCTSTSFPPGFFPSSGLRVVRKRWPSQTAIPPCPPSGRGVFHTTPSPRATLQRTGAFAASTDQVPRGPAGCGQFRSHSGDTAHAVSEARRRRRPENKNKWGTRGRFTLGSTHGWLQHSRTKKPCHSACRRVPGRNEGGGHPGGSSTLTACIAVVALSY